MIIPNNLLTLSYDHAINSEENGAQSARVVTNLKEASELKSVGFQRL